jgi:adenosylcobinamide kinase / adenosylcobinamide-phosphate guanylyltransferase
VGGADVSAPGRSQALTAQPFEGEAFAVSELHFIIGGMRSGKSRHAQTLAASQRQVTVIATALAADDEMRERIDRHRADRPAHWRVIEVPSTENGLADAIEAHTAVDTCLLIDCLTLWLSQLICPPPGVAAVDAGRATALTLQALGNAPGRIIVVSNEIGLGVVPMDAAARRVVDALGRLHQDVAAMATQVSWMVAGLPVIIKGARA